MNELALGARFAFAGGWARAVLTAVGVGLGVALLLLAASLPAALQARQDRTAARDDTALAAQPDRGAGTLLVGAFDTSYGDRDVRGRMLQPDGPHAPVPPGVRRLPGPGELVVSPALAALLKTHAGELLAARLRGKVVGTIGDAGLKGPQEYAFYLGSNRLDGTPAAYRISSFGRPASGGGGYGAVLTLLVVIALVVLLLPVGVFIATAARFGSEQRDRRMAALRLVGADAGMARRIAAGESVVGAVLGLAAGALLFLAGRQLAGHVTLWDISLFPGDLRPSPALAVLVAAAVPAAAIVVTLLALRRAVVDPLGVVRRAGGGRRRLWWRVAIPAIGLLALAPMLGGVGAGFNPYQVGAGVVALLVGLTALLPWVLEAAVRRLRGGSVAWQLAVRRLQLDAGASARAISGIAVAVAGAIALQTLFSVVQERSTAQTGADVTRAQVLASARGGPSAAERAARFAAVPGVRAAIGVSTLSAAQPGRPPTMLSVADCTALRQLVKVGRCADGDVFLVPSGDESSPRAGEHVVLGLGHGAPTRWTVPASARRAASRLDPSGGNRSGIFATPAAVGRALPPDAVREVYVRIDKSAPPPTLDLVRNAAAASDPLTGVAVLQAQHRDRRFAGIRRGLFAGAVATLALIGASMLVTAAEQLRERRRLLAMLVALGTRRSTLGWSLLWQAALPIALGLLLAIAVGVGLGAVLLAMVREPVGFSWGSIAAMAGAGAGVILVVTALTLPLLWRLMRPDGLRTE